jgi:hypothetical protein
MRKAAEKQRHMRVRSGAETRPPAPHGAGRGAGGRGGREGGHEPGRALLAVRGGWL